MIFIYGNQSISQKEKKELLNYFEKITQRNLGELDVLLSTRISDTTAIYKTDPV